MSSGSILFHTFVLFWEIAIHSFVQRTLINIFLGIKRFWAQGTQK